MFARLWRESAVLPLVLVIAAGAALCGVFAIQVTQWTVMSDELLYRRLAEGMARTLSPVAEIHGNPAEYPTVLYPALMAPIFGTLDPISAFRAAHAVNALLMASAAVPAFLLARRLVATRALALLAALLTVLVPWLAFSTVILTEALGYPVFLWVLLAGQRALAEPSPMRDAVAVGAVMFGTAARPQFLVLGPVLVVAAVLHAVGFGVAAGSVRVELARAARAHWLGLAIGVAAVLALPLIRRLLGPYGDLLSGQLVPPGTAAHAVDQLAVIAVGCGLVPLVVGLAWIFATLARSRDREAHAYAALALVAVPAIILVAASFDLRTAAGILYDRYAFYVAPVLLVAAVAGLADAGRLRFTLPVAAVAAALVVLAYEFTSYELPWFVSPASVFHQVLDGRVYSLGMHLGLGDVDAEVVLAAVAVVSAAAVMICARLRPWAPSAVIGGALAAYLLVQSLYVFDHLGIDRQPQPLDRGQDWVNAAVGDAIVASVPGAISQEGTGTDPYWDLEFWNPAVQRQLSYENTQAHHTELGSGQLTVDPDDGSMTLSDPVRYLVLPADDRRFMPAGEALDGYAGLTLIDVGPSPRAAWVIRGTDSEGGWLAEGATAIVDVYDDARHSPAQRVTLTLVPPPGLHAPRSVTIRGGARTVHAAMTPGGPQEVAVTACLEGRPHRALEVEFEGGTRLPSGVRAGGAVLTARTAPAGACPG